MFSRYESCYVCGHQGYSRLLVSCSHCSQLSIHKYCLGIIPGSDDDKEDTYWVCYYCEQSTNSATSDRMSDNVSMGQKTEDKPEIILVGEELKPLRALFPEGYKINSSERKPEPTEISMGAILIVNISREITIVHYPIFYDEPLGSTSIDTPTCVDTDMDKEVLKSSSAVKPEKFGDGKKSKDKSRRGTKRTKRVTNNWDMIGFRRSPRFKRTCTRDGVYY